MSRRDDTTVTPSCGNIFADLGLPNADELLAMSHRALDEIAELRRRLAEVDAEIAAVRAAHVVDFAALGDLRQTRDTLLARLAAKEEAAL